MTGSERIRAVFNNGRPAALMPYFTIGYPDLPTSIEIIEACCRSGADLMELGVPFSDPLADGPTVQESTQAALAAGATTQACFDAVSELRRKGITTPFLLMGYYNPVLRFGLKAYVAESVRAGVDGYIIPDLPPDEAGELDRLSGEQGLGMVYMLAPNSPEARIDLVLSRACPFIYLVSVTGVTGARDRLPEDLARFVRRVRNRDTRRTPLAVGFGISDAPQAAAVAQTADGVIVGSALIRAARDAIRDGRSPVESSAAFVRSLAAGVESAG